MKLVDITIVRLCGCVVDVRIWEETLQQNREKMESTRCKHCAQIHKARVNGAKGGRNYKAKRDVERAFGIRAKGGRKKKT